MKRSKRLIRQIFQPYMTITVIVLLSITWYTSAAVRNFILDQTHKELANQGSLFEKMAHEDILSNDHRIIDQLCKEIALLLPTRITVILPDGKVIGDSLENPADMGNHKNRPEIAEALAGAEGSSIRYSGTLRQKMMYVAFPYYMDGSVVAVIRTSLPLTSIDHKLKSINTRIVSGGVLIALFAAVICFFVSRRICRPIEEMRLGAEKLAAGDFSHRLNPPDIFEIASLARAMNKMAIQLENRLATVLLQRNEYRAVLSSMIEGVIALDMEDKVISINQAAADIFRITTSGAEGRSIQEIIRNPELHTLIKATSPAEKIISKDITVYNDKNQIVNTSCTPLFNLDKKRIGILIVLHDVTRIRNLENMRRDFVANVSHEIKTPLTAIKGFVETLQDSINERPRETQRFISIIIKHVDRLNCIVEDLLSLAKIEKKGGRKEIELEEKRIKDVIDTAIQVVFATCGKKNIKFDLQCDTEITAKIDSTLLEQALVNILDNAVKYSPDGEDIIIHSGLREGEIFISIADNGQGIAKEHIPRLFERFYRVDKARSRKMGGTGLGLSIVKHIVQTHGGRVTVDSAPGKGSTFTIYLPK